MHIFTQDQIASVINKIDVIKAVRNGFISHFKGKSKSAEPMQFLFKDNKDKFIGDCHVKGAQSVSLDMFAVKVASGFYNNSQLKTQQLI